MGFVVGLTAEARIAARFGYPVEIGGGSPAGAALAATRLIGQGTTALISFGLAGGLDPELKSGQIVVPATVLSEGEALPTDRVLSERFGGCTGQTLLAGFKIAASANEKESLQITTGAHAIDLESGAVARIASAHGLPFAVVRAICDPAARNLPPAAMIALDASGRVGLVPILRSILSLPSQIPNLLCLAADAARARRALIRLTRSCRPHQMVNISSR